jgi:recombination protein RecA
MGKQGKKEVDQRDDIQRAVDAVKKKHKKSTMGMASEKLKPPSVWASFGALSLDRVVRGKNPGGVPVGPTQGRIVHLAGAWSTGKSLILDHIFKSVQDLGGVGVCSETEATRDPHFANVIGLNLDELVLGKPETIEDAFAEFILWHDSYRENNPLVPIIWGIDSLDSTEAARTADASLTQTGLFEYGGGRSKALGNCLRKFTNQICNHHPTTLIMLNQTRDKIGVMFGDKKTTPGGNPPHFYASLEIQLKIGQKGDVRGKYVGAKLTKDQKKRLGMRATDRGDVIGRWIRAKVTKNKLSGNYGQEADFYISFDRGVRRWVGLLQRMLHEGKVSMHVGDKIGHGENVFPDEREWLKWVSQNPRVLE